MSLVVRQSRETGEQLDCCLLKPGFLAVIVIMLIVILNKGGSIAESLACWTQAQKGPGSNRSRDAVVG